MTRELAAYVLEIRIDLKNKIDMLTPTPGMTELSGPESTDIVDRLQAIGGCSSAGSDLRSCCSGNTLLEATSSFAPSTSIGDSDQIDRTLGLSFSWMTMSTRSRQARGRAFSFNGSRAWVSQAHNRSSLNRGLPISPSPECASSSAKRLNNSDVRDEGQELSNDRGDCHSKIPGTIKTRGLPINASMRSTTTMPAQQG